MKDRVRFFKRLSAAFAATIPAALIPLADARPATLTVIANPPGIELMYPNAMTSTGTVMVGVMFTASFQQSAFRWTPGGGVEDLTALTSGEMVGVTGVSEDGVTYYCTRQFGSDRVPALWTQAGGFVNIPNLGFACAQTSELTPFGSAAVGSLNSTCSFGNATTGFLWTLAGGTISVGVVPGSTGSRATSVTPDGLRVVGRSSFSGSAYGAFSWTSGTGIQPLPLPSGVGWATAANIADSSDTIVGSGQGSGTVVPVIWRNGVPGRLDMPTPAASYPHAVPRTISSDGTVIAGEAISTGFMAPTGMLWSTFGVKHVKDVLIAQGVVPPPDFTRVFQADVTTERTRIYGTYSPQGTGKTIAFTATILPPCSGDLNANGSVNTDDLVAFLAAFGKCPGEANYTSGADLAGPSNCINTADLVSFLARFGQSCP